MLNAALSSEDPEKLRAALKDGEVFAATHEQVSSTRTRFEAQRSEGEAPTVEKHANPEKSEVVSSEEFLASFDPTALPHQRSSQHEL